MGSMVQQSYLRQDVCPEVAKAAVEAVAGRVPVFVGAMDCSIGRAKDRIAAMEDLDVDGFVFTTPYYYPCSPDQIINYFKGVAAAKYLDNITALRDCFVANNLWASYAYAMNLLGYEGKFNPDYVSEITDAGIENVRAEMVRIGEI